MQRKTILFLAVLLAVGFSLVAYAGGLSTSGKCSWGVSCDIGHTTTTSMTFTTDGATLGVDTTTNALTLTATTTDTAVFTGADAAGAANTTYDTTGAGAITIGSGDVTEVTVTTVGATLSIDATTNELTLTASGANTAVIMGADAAGAADLLIDTTGTGAITIGSSEVTSVSVVTDGGTITLDGTVNSRFSVVSLAGGALTPNTVHLATASAADYDLPATFCATAGNIGNWVTVIVEDASSTISITVDDTSNVIIVPQLSLAADEELDSVSDANGEGTHITLVCMAVDGIYATSMSDIAGVIAWADGGAAD